VKIVDVRAHCIASPLETPFAFSQGWVKSRGACLEETFGFLLVINTQIRNL
jgi:hypothetical protein